MRPFIDLFLDLLGTSTTKIHRLAVYNWTYLTHSNSSLVTKTGAVLNSSLCELCNWMCIYMYMYVVNITGE